MSECRPKGSGPKQNELGEKWPKPGWEWDVKQETSWGGILNNK